MGSRQIKVPVGTRSQSKAFIVLLGLTGAGKTTTLNFLFDGMEIAKTESYASATSQILEYSVQVPVDKAGNCELRVIDTPGFGDTRQKPLERDAQFMATFDRYLSTHPDLKTCYPTAVLLVVKYNDDRIDGETSHFIQMLQALDKLLTHYRLIDMGPEKCNLIEVLTHTMSEDNEELRADPSPKIKLIEGMIKKFTRIPTPIRVVMAENKPHLYNLPVHKGYHKLPNGQYYPLNLFQKIQRGTEKCDDIVGETIIREAFKNPTSLKKELLTQLSLDHPDNPIVKQNYTILNDARFRIESTAMSEKLKELWENLDESLTKPYFNTLQITQSAFHKFKIFLPTDIPTTKEETLKLLAELPTNPPLVKVLESIGINAPELPDKTMGVGCFYNVFGDVIITGNTPFDVHDYTWTEIGYRAPKCIRGKAIGETVSIVSSYKSKVQYHKERLASLQVTGEMSPDKFVGDAKPGHNVIVRPLEVHKLTGIKEYRQYEVLLTKKPRFSVQFWTALTQLPPFSQTSKAAWKSFFLATGTHVVKSAYIGGHIEVVAVRNPDKTPATSTDTILMLINEVLANIGTIFTKNLEAVAEDWDFSLHFHGGDQNLARPTLTNIFSRNGVEFYKKWVASLQTHPALLYSEIKLENLILHVQDMDVGLSEQLDVAMRQLANTTGFISPPEPDHIDSRDETKTPKQSIFYRFMSMFKRR